MVQLSKCLISGLFVSSDGEVFVPESSKGGKRSHTTYGCTDNKGYKQVLYKYKHYSVHRLVGECFIPNPDNLPTIDHINRDKTDNRVENLRWADYSLQITNQNHQKNDAKSKPVLQYTPEGELVREWPSIMECHRNGFNKSAVCKCCSGKLKHHKGYIFKYK